MCVLSIAGGMLPLKSHPVMSARSLGQAFFLRPVKQGTKLLLSGNAGYADFYTDTLCRAQRYALQINTFR